MLIFIVTRRNNGIVTQLRGDGALFLFTLSILANIWEMQHLFVVDYAFSFVAPGHMAKEGPVTDHPLHPFVYRSGQTVSSLQIFMTWCRPQLLSWNNRIRPSPEIKLCGLFVICGSCISRLNFMVTFPCTLKQSSVPTRSVNGNSLLWRSCDKFKLESKL